MDEQMLMSFIDSTNYDVREYIVEYLSPRAAVMMAAAAVELLQNVGRVLHYRVEARRAMRPVVSRLGLVVNARAMMGINRRDSSNDVLQLMCDVSLVDQTLCLQVCSVEPSPGAAVARSVGYRRVCGDFVPRHVVMDFTGMSSRVTHLPDNISITESVNDVSTAGLSAVVSCGRAFFLKSEITSVDLCGLHALQRANDDFFRETQSLTSSTSRH
jgi:hypothetical protein